jgi:hypothetical protein
MQIFPNRKFPFYTLQVFPNFDIFSSGLLSRRLDALLQGRSGRSRSAINPAFRHAIAIMIPIKNISGKIGDRFSDQIRSAIFILKPDRD